MSRIMCAAIHFDDGKKHRYQPDNIKTGFVIAGRRHSDVMYTVVLLNQGKRIDVIDETEGFLTTDNKFLNRFESYEVAKDQKQLICDCSNSTGGRLTSDDLW